MQQLKSESASFFEHVVIDLLIAMGYGGGRSEMVEVTGGTGDGGIDGIIREDALGLDEIYIQAKKYTESNIGADELRKFAGALDTKRTNKGVFVTTSDFTKSTREYVENNSKQIVLIDGAYLSKLMVQYNIGVRERKHMIIKTLDQDYVNINCM